MADLLRALLRDVLPNAKDAYLFGTADDRLQEVLDERGIATHQPAVGADPLPLVIAAGGLSSYALAEHISWQEACARAAALLAPGGTLVVGLAGESTLASLLSNVPATPGSDETRPRSAAQLKDALRTAGLQGSTVHLLFGAAGRPGAILTQKVAAQARPGTLPALAVEQAVTSAGTGRTLLDPLDAVDRAAQAGALELAATGFVLVAGGRGHDLYLVEGDQAVAAEADPSGQWLLPDRVLPGAPGLEARLHSALATADLPAFRELAAAIGSFVRTDPLATSVEAVRLQHMVADGEGRIGWLFPPTQDGGEGDSDALLAAMWWEFLHRLGYRRDSLPWPGLTDDADLVRSWLRMSGADQDRATPPAPAPAARSVQQDAFAVSRDTERSALIEERLRLGNEALERRDNQLTVRETAIRMLRGQLIAAQEDKEKADVAAAALKSGKAYKVARRVTLLTDPKETVKVVGNKLDTTVKKVRRMR